MRISSASTTIALIRPATHMLIGQTLTSLVTAVVITITQKHILMRQGLLNLKLFCVLTPVVAIVCFANISTIFTQSIHRQVSIWKNRRIASL